MQSIVFHQADYMAGQVIQEVKNVKQLVSWVLEIIPPNNTDQWLVPDQDTPYDLILWYVAKTIYLLKE